MPRFLAEHLNDDRRRASFASQLEMLSPSVRVCAPPRGGDPTACFAAGSKKGVPFDDLSSSESDAVLIAATATLVGLSHSVVFLDRPELYVSSDRLANWVEALSRLGQKNQWFIATSDRSLAESIGRAHVVSLEQGGASTTRPTLGRSA